jgi:hypothetical protein
MNDKGLLDGIRAVDYRTEGRTAMIVNLTPYAVTLIGERGVFFTIEPSGKVARVSTGIKVSEIEVVDLPEPDGQTRYVVSRDVVMACPDRDDLMMLLGAE